MEAHCQPDVTSRITGNGSWFRLVPLFVPESLPSPFLPIIFLSPLPLSRHDLPRPAIQPLSNVSYACVHCNHPVPATTLQVGKKSAWGPQSSSRQNGQDPVVRRFDIDDEDNDDGIGQLRSKHPQYSFDVGRGGFNGAS